MHSSQSVVASLVTYAYQITKLLKSYEDMRCWMSVKIHFLHSLNVTQDSFSPFPPQLLPAKPWSSEWWAWRKIPLRHYEDGEQLSKQIEPRQDGRLLLYALAWHPGGKIHQIFKENTFDCLWYYELCNCVIQVYWFNQCSLSILFYRL